MSVYITDADFFEKLISVEEPATGWESNSLADYIAEVKRLFLQQQDELDSELVLYGVGGWNRYLVERKTGRLIFIRLQRRCERDEQLATAAGFDLL